MLGRPRKHQSNAARQREYRLRQRQLRILLSIRNPEPGSLPWQVQYAEFMRRIRVASVPKMVVEPTRAEPASEALEPNASNPEATPVIDSSATIAAQPVIERAPTPNPPVLVDDMRGDLPPRSPAEIQELLKIETPEQRDRRLENDIRRYMNQRFRFRACDAR